MRKFECRECYKPCVLLLDDNMLSPCACVYGTRKYKWHEVKEDSAENEQFGNSEQLPSNPRKLPDWAKVGEWFYDVVLREYYCFKEGGYWSWYIENIEDGTIIQARKRPFNEKEMKALVGQVIEGTSINFRALIHYYTSADDSVCTIYNSYNAKELMENHITIDGKPCYVLEHLNEKGEWVE